MPRPLAIWLLAAALAPAFAVPARADDKLDPLDAALLKRAPEVIKYLRDHNWKTVGVLKFLVKQGDGLSDNVGPLNKNLAARLEVALVLAAPDERLKLLADASAAVTAANNRRANHRTPEGRRALFDGRYKPAWGAGDKLQADAFVTGVAELDRELKKMTVTVQAFGKDSEDLAVVCKFDVATDGRTLSEAGKSYHARGPGGEQLRETVEAKKVDEGKAPHPVESKAAPVKLTILYGDGEVPVRNGEVPEPPDGKAVTFRLENRGAETCGVVLKVNGENTLFRQRVPSAQCYKWILAPGEKVTILGFQVGLKNAQRFVVKAPEQFEKGEVNYSADLGTITLDVFRERKKGDFVRAEEPREELVAIGRGTLAAEGEERAGSLKALQGRLKRKVQDTKDDGAKGVIGAGQKVEFKVEPIQTDLESVPVLSATVRYYRPR